MRSERRDFAVVDCGAQGIWTGDRVWHATNRFMAPVSVCNRHFTLSPDDMSGCAQDRRMAPAVYMNNLDASTAREASMRGCKHQKTTHRRADPGRDTRYKAAQQIHAVHIVLLRRVREGTVMRLHGWNTGSWCKVNSATSKTIFLWHRHEPASCTRHRTRQT